MSKTNLHKYKDYEALNSKHSVDYVIKQYASSNSITRVVDVTNYSQVMISCSNQCNIRFATEGVVVSTGGGGTNEWDIGHINDPSLNGQDVVLLTVPDRINDVKVDTVILNIKFVSSGDTMYLWLM